MKVAVVLLACVALGCSAPQPRKLFHEHFEDFIEVIVQEAGEELEGIVDHYLESEEFQQSLDYILTTNFRDLIFEMESLPEFNAVIQFLENDNIDVMYFLDRFNEMIAGSKRRRLLRFEPSGSSLSAYISDCIALFPQDKLAALFEQKKEEDDGFRVAIENLDSEAWGKAYGALWANKVFQKEVQTLGQNGIHVNLLLNELKAIFGQNE